jgi:xanthine dehydrogenase accessory factor
MAATHTIAAEAPKHVTAGRWLIPLHQHWSSELSHCLTEESCVVRVMVAASRGSAPREAGACMLITPSRVLGTIGGGHLEFQALGLARAMLDNINTHKVQVRRIILGRELAQCCGGEVHLWLERHTRSDLPLINALSRAAGSGQTLLLIRYKQNNAAVTRQLLHQGSPEIRELQTRWPTADWSSSPTLLNTDDDTLLIERIVDARARLWLYGAGHVGQALIRMLAELPFDITWVDTRAELLPDTQQKNVRTVHAGSVLEIARGAPPDAHHRVLTHDHALDYALCHEILQRNEFASLGLIGSRSKSARFRAQLRRDGVAAERIAKLICPIGIGGIGGIASKVPAAIAISIAAQLLAQAETAAPNTTDRQTSHADASCEGAACTRCHAGQEMTHE